jgi:hypothetical protein
MENKCIICGEEIPFGHAQLLTLEGSCCLSHEGSEELKKILEESKKKSIAILNNHLE